MLETTLVLLNIKTFGTLKESSYVMRPESVNDGLHDLNKLLETYCNLESKNTPMWSLQQNTAFVFQDASWLKKLNKLLGAEVK